MDRIKWLSTAGQESGHGNEGNETYESTNPGFYFWEKWLGAAVGWQEPKLNWTADDYYNFEDLNRVEKNTEVVAELVGFFVTLPPFVFVTDRNMDYIDFADSFTRIESMQNVMRQRFTPVDWETNKLEWLPNDRFSFDDARRLEHNTNLLYKHYKWNIDYISRCGATVCGEAMV